MDYLEFIAARPTIYFRYGEEGRFIVRSGNSAGSEKENSYIYSLDKTARRFRASSTSGRPGSVFFHRERNFR